MSISPPEAPSAGFGERVSARLAGLDRAVVHVMNVAPAEPRPLTDVARDEWDAQAEAPIRDALAALQAAHAALAGGGAVVVVVPTLAQTGAAGFAPLAAAAEGVRLLAKSAARAWGKDGVRVNCVTAPADAWGVHADVPSKHGAALEERDAAVDVAGVATFLCGPLAAGVTGATIAVDRGIVMAP